MFHIVRIFLQKLYCPMAIHRTSKMCIRDRLRSGGDTKMCLFLDTSGVWCIGVPLAFLGALVWHLPIYVVYGLSLIHI